MNREIKFRAWDVDLKEMFYSETEQFDDMLGFRFKHFDTDKPVYMQYTGLKDKNGKEIYENDIVKFSNNPIHEGVLAKCVFLSSRAGFFYIFLTGSNKDKCTDMYDDWREYEVIGNMFESTQKVTNENN